MDFPLLEYVDLSLFADKCRSKLLTEEPYHFKYPSDLKGNETTIKWEDRIKTIKRLNGDFLSSLRSNGNLYMIFIKNDVSNSWESMYIGERKSVDMRQRLSQHLINNSEGTGSKFSKIQKAVREGKQIGVTVIKVEPEGLRLYVEEHILSNSAGNFLWNAHR